MALLQAFCQEQAREAISALVPRVPEWAIDTQVDRASEALRLRYGCCSFLSEPLVKEIRSGLKFNKMDVNALEQLLSELNDCELYSTHEHTSKRALSTVLSSWISLSACLSISKPSTLIILWIIVEIQLIPPLTLSRPF